jgi:hypothetical protein
MTHLAEHHTLHGFVIEGGGRYHDEAHLKRDLIVGYDEDVGEINPAVSRRGADSETELFVCALFSRNIAGAACAISQFNKPYVSFRVFCPSRFEEASGTERAKEALRETMADALRPFAGHVAVWRKWPEIYRDADGIGISARFHLVTEKTYETYFVK